jgi:hypothetical protein
MGFHYARDHDLAGFWREVCELAHRVHREAALLPPTPIADLEKTLNIGPTQRLFRQVSACHQDVEIPAQALHEQVFFVLEFRIQARFANTCGLFKWERDIESLWIVKRTASVEFFSPGRSGSSLSLNSEIAQLASASAKGPAS